jgi:hypothetical protein
VDAFTALKDLVKPRKAKLCVYPGDKHDGPAEVECMFNPTEYRLTQRAIVSRTETPLKNAGTAEFGGTGPITLSMQLLFDDFGSLEGDVTPKIDTLLGWQRPTATEEDKKTPPRVQFLWGGNPQLNRFRGILTSIAVNYTVFRRDGRPVQAKVDVTIEGEEDPKFKPNPTSHASGTWRIHTVVEGDSLQSVAFAELGKATYWRAIAELNGIDDPLRVRPGTALLIPTLADAARTS